MVTPTVSGTYKVYASVPLYQATSGTIGIIRIYETTALATLLAESQGSIESGSSTGEGTVFVQSVYNLTAGTTYQFDVQGLNGTTGSLYIASGNSGNFFMFAERVN
jgi:hypothetical protein